jgi:predicted acetyltransferase
MKVELREAHARDVPVLRRLMQLYLYDFSAIDGWTIASDGLYGSASSIELFWTEPKRKSFLIYADGVLAGFVLIRDGARFAGEGTREISEFFVLRHHRRHGVGALAARRVFDMFPGKWELTQITSNTAAQAFWRQVISAYTRGRYLEMPRPDGEGTMHRFDNATLKR